MQESGKRPRYEPTETQRAYRERHWLNAGERAMLAMLRDLQLKKGYAFPSVDVMAASLNVHVRTVKRMLNGTRRKDADGAMAVTREGLIDRGYVSRLKIDNVWRYRVTEPPASRMDSTCGQPVANEGVGVTQMSPRGVTQMSPPGVTQMSPMYVKNYSSYTDGGVTFQQAELFHEVKFRATTGVHGAPSAYSLEQRICYAFSRYRTFTHLDWQGQRRKILQCNCSSTALILSLAPIDPASIETERITIPLTALTDQQFFKQSRGGAR